LASTPSDASQKFSVAERESFRQHQVFVTGGGSLGQAIAKQMEEHPSHYRERLRICSLDSPADLFDKGKRANSSDLVFLAAAFGLSYDAWKCQSRTRRTAHAQPTIQKDQS